MPQTLVVGVDGTPAGEDAAALARVLAEPHGARVVLAHVPLMADILLLDAPPEELGELQARGREATAGALPHLGDSVETEVRIRPASSAARALHDLAEEEDADLLVLGSTHRGDIGRVFPGGTAQRLLVASPCALAIAPSGYAARAPQEIRRIGVAFDDSAEARLALAHAAEHARRLGVPLSLVYAIHPISDRPPWQEYREHIRAHARGRLDAALAELGDDVRADAQVVEGPPGEAVAGTAAEAGVDLLFCGSRGYGPARRVLLGDVAGEIVRRASCPVVVVPRSA